MTPTAAPRPATADQETIRLAAAAIQALHEAATSSPWTPWHSPAGDDSAILGPDERALCRGEHHSADADLIVALRGVPSSLSTLLLTLARPSVWKRLPEDVQNAAILTALAINAGAVQ